MDKNKREVLDRAPVIPELTADPVVDANCALLKQRSQVGIKKYGSVLPGTLGRRELVQHALEEALDLANYLQADLQVLDRAPVIESIPHVKMQGNAEHAEFLESYKGPVIAARPTADQQAVWSVEALPEFDVAEMLDSPAAIAAFLADAKSDELQHFVGVAVRALAALDSRAQPVLPEFNQCKNCDARTIADNPEDLCPSCAQPVAADAVEVAWVVVLPSGEPELSIVYTDRNEAQDYIENRAIDGCTLRGLSFSSAQPVAPRPTDDELWDQTIRDRDTYHEWADKLAEAISKHFDAYIGEHSNTNCPWAEALEAIDSAQPVEAGEDTLHGKLFRMTANLAVANHRLATAAQIDWHGLALDLKQQAKCVESQTAERAMTAAAHGLRLMGEAVTQQADGGGA